MKGKAPDPVSCYAIGASASLQSTIILGQMPWSEWHEFIGAPAIADAIMDRLIHSSVKLRLKGDSMRQKKMK
jgi:DNA replication protein DnaC